MKVSTVAKLNPLICVMFVKALESLSLEDNLHLNCPSKDKRRQPVIFGKGLY